MPSPLLPTPITGFHPVFFLSMKQNQGVFFLSKYCGWPTIMIPMWLSCPRGWKQGIVKLDPLSAKKKKLIFSGICLHFLLYLDSPSYRKVLELFSFHSWHSWHSHGWLLSSGCALHSSSTAIYHDVMTRSQGPQQPRTQISSLPSAAGLLASIQRKPHTNQEADPSLMGRISHTLYTRPTIFLYSNLRVKV